MVVYKEITPLSQKDAFIILNSEKIGFEYPIHYHSAYELTLILNSSGNRIIGDSVEKYNTNDLVLIGPEIYHKWDDDDMPPKERNNAHVITIQFSKDLFNQSLFLKECFFSIKGLLKDSQKGLKFNGETFKIVALRMQNLVSIKGFDALLEFLKILQLLSNSNDKKFLAGEGFVSIKEHDKGDRVNKMYNYILANFNDRNLRITKLAQEANMSSSAFGHFFKKCTNKSFTQFVVDLRLGHASKLLLDSNLSISEIAFVSGFNNIANFNRLFKKNKLVTPKRYRQNLIRANNFNWKKQLGAYHYVPSKKLNSNLTV